MKKQYDPNQYVDSDYIRDMYEHEFGGKEFTMEHPDGAFTIIARPYFPTTGYYSWRRNGRRLEDAKVEIRVVNIPAHMRGFVTYEAVTQATKGVLKLVTLTEDKLKAKIQKAYKVIEANYNYNKELNDERNQIEKRAIELFKSEFPELVENYHVRPHIKGNRTFLVLPSTGVYVYDNDALFRFALDRDNNLASIEPKFEISIDDAKQLIKKHIKTL
jgi:hypothetical protein